MNAETVDPITGEVRKIAEAAALYISADATVTKLEQELAEVKADLDGVRRNRERYAEQLLAAMDPGDSIQFDDRVVVCRHGARRNATVDKAACEEHAEILADLGLGEIVTPPPPAPVFKPPKVSMLRAAETELALRGVKLRDLVREGGPGDPVVEVVEERP